MGPRLNSRGDGPLVQKVGEHALSFNGAAT
jgi:hypothetical protein